MNPTRLVAAAAAVLTALLLQAALVGPVSGLVMVSLPAVLVAVVALREGPATGLVLGFVCGLLADLGSTHPAGVLALVWLLLGAACGLARDPHRAVRWQVGVLVLLVVGAAPGGAATLLGHAVLAWPGDLLLGGLLYLPVRGMLRSQALRTVQHG